MSAIDPLGRRTLETDDGAAAIELHSDEHYLALLGYRGPTGCLLATLFLGAPRVPYLGVREVGWEDALSPAPFLGPLGRLAYELALPFVETTGLRTDSRWTPGPRPRLATRVEAVGGLPFGEALPDRVEVTFAADVGPVAITAWRGDEALVEAEGALA